MNNLYQQLAPITELAWAEINAEATRTLQEYLAARKVVDVDQSDQQGVAAFATGHIEKIESPEKGVQASLRQVNPLVELRVPFELSRAAIDDVQRGAQDSDWQPLKDAARKIAQSEDQIVFEGYKAAGIQGMRQGSSNQQIQLPASVKNYAGAIASAKSELQMAGVGGPYKLVLGAEEYLAINSGSDEGYPVLRHVLDVLGDGEIILGPSLKGGFLLSVRGGDYTLKLGQDISIGYLSHTDTTVKLYLQEAVTFQLHTSEAVVCLKPAAK